MRNFNALQTIASALWCFGAAFAAIVLAKRLAQRLRKDGD
jgi:hypothetical protein